MARIDNAGRRAQPGPVRAERAQILRLGAADAGEHGDNQSGKMLHPSLIDAPGRAGYLIGEGEALTPHADR